MTIFTSPIKTVFKWARQFLPFFLFFSFFNNVLLAQNHSFQHFTVDDGLPSSEVYHVYQTSKGYIFLTTDRGVSTFDGYSFTNYSLQEGVPDNTVFEMFENAPNDELWFYSFSGKIFSFSNDQFTVLQSPIGFEDQFNFSNYIKSIYVAEDGVIWLAITQNDGFVCINKKGEFKKNVLLDSTSKIQTLSEDKNGYSVAMNKLGKEWTLTLKDKTKINLTDVIAEKKVTEIVRDMIENDSSIFLRFPSTILQINKFDKSHIFFETHTDAINNMYLDNHGDLWVGLIQQGTLKFSNADLSNQPKNLLKGESVTSILQDIQGGYWFSTLDNGVFYMPWEEFYSYDETDRICNTVTLLNNELWAGYAYGEITQYLEDGSINKFKLPEGHRYNTVQSIVGFADKVYANCSNIIYEINNGDVKSKYSQLYSRKLTRTNNELWALGNGFYLLENEKTPFSSLSIGFDRWITAICQATDSTYLIGTFDGVYNFDGTNIGINTYNIPALNERISDIKIMGNNIVFATIGNGLVIKKPDSTYQLINEKNGLISNVCNSVYIDNDSVFWVSTNNGINKITWHTDTNSSETFNINSVTKQDGLKSSEVHQVLIKNNYAWAATNKGLVKFDKNLQEFSQNSIPVYIKSARVNGKAIDINNQIELSHDENNIEIDFIALFYQDQKKIQYRYKLQTNDEWIYTHNTTVQLSNLIHKKYNFILEASIDKNHWIRAKSEVIFTIYPPIWTTGWFQVFYILMGGVLISSFFYLRIDSLKKKTELKRKALESEYKALRAQLNPHFMFNSLNAINSFILNNDKFSASKYLSKFSKLMRLTLDNSSESYISLNNELETLKLYLEMEVVRTEGKFKFTIFCDKNIRQEKYEIPAMLVQPFIENAVWHGIMPLNNNNGIINVTFNSYSDCGIKCVIEDNGIGRAKSGAINKLKNSGHKSQAMCIIEKRLKVISDLRKYDYNFDIIDNIIGTTIIIIIPTNSLMK